MEIDLVRQGRVVLGMDEVGRGPAAGPMVFAGVVYCEYLKSITGLNDSKKVSKKNRELMFDEITNNCKFGIGIVWPYEIDDYGLRNCFQIAMQRVISCFGSETNFDFLLLDGSLKFEGSIEWMSIVKGDEKFLSVAAASIVAKVFRDRIMMNYADEFPFRFDMHKAYLTKRHLLEIREHGLQRIHRHSYKIQI